MTLLRRILVSVFVVALCGAVALGLYFVTRFLLGRLADLTGAGPGVAASVVATLLLLLLIGYWTGRGLKRTRTDRLREDCSELYARFLDVWSEELTQGPSVGSMDRLAAAPSTLEAVERRLVMVGSTGFLKAYVAYRKLRQQFAASDPAVRTAIERVLVEIRRDLGRSSVLFNDGELITLFLASGSAGTEAGAETAPPRLPDTGQQEPSRGEDVVVLTD